MNTSPSRDELQRLSKLKEIYEFHRTNVSFEKYFISLGFFVFFSFVGMYYDIRWFGLIILGVMLIGYKISVQIKNYKNAERCYSDYELLLLNRRKTKFDN